MAQDQHPVRFSVQYPDRDLDRVTTAFRLFTAIPIAIVLGAVSGAVWTYQYDPARDAVVATSVGAGGLLVFGPLLMILFRQKYPRWWFDWNLNLIRWLPLVKWFLAIPHYFVLAVLWIGAVLSVIIAWFAILFTGRYPRGLFDYVEGVFRWGIRVTAYAFVMATDRYPPFRLRP